MPQETWPKPYELRLVAFIDILGFKNIVQGTKDERRLKSVLRAIDRLRELSEDVESSSKQVSQFSDSIVISYPVRERASVFYLLLDIAMAVLDLVYWGFAVRGGVTIGPLIHDEKHLLGQGLIDAYEMEAKHAKYPRVLVDPKLLKLARIFHAPQNSPDDEAGYVRDLLREDEDNRFFLDYTSWNAYFGLHGDVDGYDDYLTSISKMVKAQLKSKDASVREKGLWLQRLYIDALDALLDQPEDSQFYRENEAACLAARRLPRFKKSANAVRKELRKRRQKLKSLDAK
uniref:Guanylate cyclase domain-containing protein n=1 Tax=mine drainage metagenome TaxID=410659 RepID=E6Q0P3_9ZZZZ